MGLDGVAVSFGGVVVGLDEIEADSGESEGELEDGAARRVEGWF